MEEFDGFYIGSLILGLLVLIATILLIRLRPRLSGKKWFPIWWNVQIVLLILMLVFISGETYYRFYVDTTDSFAVNKISKRWLKKNYQFNNRGMRDNIDYEYNIQKGKRRLSIIGDSFTGGHGIKNVDNRFGNILRSKYPNLEVHLLTNSGANTKVELKLLNDLYDDGYQFDIIVLVYCLNDIDYFIESSSRVYKRIHNFQNKLSYLERNSYFINTLTFRLFALFDSDFMNYSNFVLNAYSNEKWEMQKEQLKKFSAFVKSINKPLIVVTFPFLQQTAKEYQFYKTHQSIGQFWAEEKVLHFDLLETFKPYLGPKLTVNKYDAHPNEFANELAAEAIDKFLTSAPPQ